MPDVSLVAEVGRPTGTRNSRRLRAQGKIPAVVYGHGMDALPVVIDAKELRVALSTAAGANALLSLKVGGEQHLVLARELQRHPVRGSLLHVDFQVVRRDELIVSEVPIVITGEARDVHHEGGIVEQQLFNLTVRAVPSDIPSAITVDVSGLEVGSVIRVADLPLPPGVTAEVDGDTVVVAGQVLRAKAAQAGVQREESSSGAEGEVG
ncbi:MAG: 50S ribosomal protein L25 [Actinobacteria bacterium]|nr:50S ribosomal protein L25 [Actinomycetota bacterium]